MQKIAAMSAISIILTSLACSSGGGKKADRPAQNPSAGPETGFALLGLEATTWVSNCVASESGKSSAQITMKIQDNSLEKESKYYDLAECAPTELYAERDVTYQDIRITNSDEIPNSKLVKSKLEGIYFLAHKDDFTATLNKESVYGSTDWVTGEKKNVSGLAYDSETRAEWETGKKLDQIYKIENDKMFFAYFDENDAPYYKDDVFFTKK